MINQMNMDNKTLILFFSSSKNKLFEVLGGSGIVMTKNELFDVYRDFVNDLWQANCTLYIILCQLFFDLLKKWLQHLNYN